MVFRRPNNRRKYTNQTSNNRRASSRRTAKNGGKLINNTIMAELKRYLEKGPAKLTFVEAREIVDGWEKSPYTYDGDNILVELKAAVKKAKNLYNSNHDSVVNAVLVAINEIDKRAKASYTQAHSMPPPPQSTKQSPAQSTKQSPPQSTKQSPPQSTKQSPAKSPEKSPEKSPAKSPEKSPEKSPAKSPEKSPEKSPKTSPPKQSMSTDNCSSRHIEPKDCTSRKDYLKQAFDFHPDKNKDCEESAKIKFQTVQNNATCIRYNNTYVAPEL